MLFDLGKQRHKQELFLSTVIYVIVIVTWPEIIRYIIVYVCNVFVDNGTFPKDPAVLKTLRVVNHYGDSDSRL